MRRILITLYVISALLLVFIVSPLSPLVVPVFYSGAPAEAEPAGQPDYGDDYYDLYPVADYTLFDTVDEAGREAEYIVTGQVVEKERRKLPTIAGRKTGETVNTGYMTYVIDVFDIAKGNLETEEQILLIQEWGETAYYDYPLYKEGIFLLVNATDDIDSEGIFFRLINPEQGFIGADFKADHITYIHLTEELRELYTGQSSIQKLTFQLIWDKLAVRGEIEMAS